MKSRGPRCRSPRQGTKQTLSALLRRLRAMHVDTAQLLARIDDLVVKTMVSVEAQVNAASEIFGARRGGCFELFGFDVLVDAALRPWLLEVSVVGPALAPGLQAGRRRQRQTCRCGSFAAPGCRRIPVARRRPLPPSS